MSSLFFGYSRSTFSSKMSVSEVIKAKDFDALGSNDLTLISNNLGLNISDAKVCHLSNGISVPDVIFNPLWLWVEIK